MPIFVRLEDEDRIRLFQNLKKEFPRWDEFLLKYKISRAMLFHYKAGRFPIPEERLLEWQNKTGRFFNNSQKIEKDRYVRKDVKNFKMDSRLAEILGALNGDGHISRKEVCIVGNINEVDYQTHLKMLFEDKFGLVFTFIEDLRQNSYKLRTYSVGLSSSLRDRYELPLGNKMGRLNVPKIVLNKRSWSLAYLRGLFDTDGCFHVRRKKDPMISITSADPSYLKEVRILLESLGFNISKGDCRIFLYGKGNVIKFFDEIKPANSKHLKKYREWYSNERGSYNGSV